MHFGQCLMTHMLSTCDCPQLLSSPLQLKYDVWKQETLTQPETNCLIINRNNWAKLSGSMGFNQECKILIKLLVSHEDE